MIIDGLTCIQAASAVSGKDYADGEGPFLGFARGADAYSGELPAGHYADIARMAMAAAYHEPPVQRFLIGVCAAFAAMGLPIPPREAHEIVARLIDHPNNHARALGALIRSSIARRNYNLVITGSAGISLFLWLRSSGHIGRASQVFSVMMEGDRL